MRVNFHLIHKLSIVLKTQKQENWALLFILHELCFWMIPIFHSASCFLWGWLAYPHHRLPCLTACNLPSPWLSMILVLNKNLETSVLEWLKETLHPKTSLVKYETGWQIIWLGPWLLQFSHGYIVKYCQYCVALWPHEIPSKGQGQLSLPKLHWLSYPINLETVLLLILWIISQMGHFNLDFFFCCGQWSSDMLPFVD